MTELAGALKLLGTERAAVVSGADGVSEVSVAGPTQVTEVGDGATRELTWRPETSARRAFAAGSRSRFADGRRRRPAQRARRQTGAAREFAVANAAAALWVAGRASTVLAGATLAREAIDSGAARDLLERLITETNAE